MWTSISISKLTVYLSDDCYHAAVPLSSKLSMVYLIQYCQVNSVSQLLISFLSCIKFNMALNFLKPCLSEKKSTYINWAQSQVQESAKATVTESHFTLICTRYNFAVIRDHHETEEFHQGQNWLLFENSFLMLLQHDSQLNVMFEQQLLQNINRKIKALELKLSEYITIV